MRYKIKPKFFTKLFFSYRYSPLSLLMWKMRERKTPSQPWLLCVLCSVWQCSHSWQSFDKSIDEKAQKAQCYVVVDTRALHCTVHSYTRASTSLTFFFFFFNFKVTFSPEIKFLVPTTSFWKCYNNLRKLLFRRKIKDYMDLWRETRIRLPKCCRLGVYSNESNMKGIMAMSTEKWYSMMVYCIQGERFVKVWGI